MKLIAAFIVASLSLPVSDRPGSRTAYGELEQGVRVEATGRRNGGWIEVRAAADIPLEGWVEAKGLGCRLSREEALLDRPGGSQIADFKEKALVRIVSSKGEWLEVESLAPALTGVIPASSCSAEVPEYRPGSPSMGKLAGVMKDSWLYAAPNTEGKGRTKVGAGLRFLVLEERPDGWARGYIDEDVEVAGWMLLSDLSDPVFPSPLAILTEKSPYDHELLLSGALRPAPKGKPFVELPEGTLLQILETRDGWVRIETAGPVRARGWLEEKEIRRVHFPEDAVAPLIRVTPQKEAPLDRGPRAPSAPDAGAR